MEYISLHAFHPYRTVLHIRFDVHKVPDVILTKAAIDYIDLLIDFSASLKT